MGRNREAKTKTKGQDKTYKGEEGGKEKEKDKEAKDQATKYSNNSRTYFRRYLNYLRRGTSIFL
jgi:hypothetical protein